MDTDAGLEREAMTVSQYLSVSDHCMRQLGRAVVKGEIAELKQYNHLYFKLKDENGCADCLMFKHDLETLNFKVEQGQQVIAVGYSSIYVKNGQFRLMVRQLQPAGLGLIFERLQRLKAQLKREGIFDRFKRPLPRVIRRVGFITSAEGRVMHDVIKTLARRMPGIEIIIYDAKVQGQEAPASLGQALRLAYAAKECDALIIGRGGGSFEDLLPFSDEQVVRLTASSPVPIISAVGHEPDFALTDFAADVRAATPTAAAELISPVTRDMTYDQIDALDQRLEDACRRVIDSAYMRLDQLELKLKAQDPVMRIERLSDRLSLLSSGLSHAWFRLTALRQQQLNNYELKLKQYAPELACMRRSKQLTLLEARMSSALDRRFKAADYQISVQTAQLMRIDLQAALSGQSQALIKLSLRLNTAMSMRFMSMNSRLNYAALRLSRTALPQALAGSAQRLEALTSKLVSLNPLSVLDRGYSLTLDANGHAVRLAHLKKGDLLTTRLKDGEITSIVMTCSPKVRPEP